MYRAVHQIPVIQPCTARVTRGFTLVEVLIVIGIFAVISSISYTSLTQYIDVTEKLAQNQAETRQMQNALTLLERDFRYMVNRSVRDEYGDTESAYIANYENGSPGEFVRLTAVHPNPALPHSAQLQRVAWRIDNGDLYRDSWEFLDRDAESDFTSLKVLENIDQIEIEQYSWSDNFGLQVGQQFSPESEFPFGLKVTIQMLDGKAYFRLFDIANGS